MNEDQDRYNWAMARKISWFSRGIGNLLKCDCPGSRPLPLPAFAGPYRYYEPIRHLRPPAGPQGFVVTVEFGPAPMIVDLLLPTAPVPCVRPSLLRWDLSTAYLARFTVRGDFPLLS
jgi:hypothetical protein